MKYRCKLCHPAYGYTTDDKEKMQTHLFREHREMSYGWTTTTAHTPDFDESVEVSE